MRKLLVLALLVGLAGCGKKATVADSVLTEHDRDLYLNAQKAMQKSRFTEARLELQTLMASYPDSEFLPQAKYLYAESFYREGGSGALNSAEAEFRDYTLFFPETDLADDAQLMVAMTHIKQMQKPDRDDTQARLAEYELNLMIKEQTGSPLLNEAKEKLRGVQEVLAESIFGPSKLYYMRGAYSAVIDRCNDIVTKYPDFSKMDAVLLEIGDAFRKGQNPQEAVKYYAQIIREYPMSESAPAAKSRLVELKVAVPPPNPLALNRSQQGRQGKGFWGMFKSRPPVSTDTGAASEKSNSTELSIDRNK